MTEVPEVIVCCNAKPTGDQLFVRDPPPDPKGKPIPNVGIEAPKQTLFDQLVP